MTKQRDPAGGQRSLLFLIDFPEIEEGLQARACVCVCVLCVLCVCVLCFVFCVFCVCVLCLFVCRPAGRASSPFGESLSSPFGEAARPVPLASLSDVKFPSVCPGSRGTASCRPLFSTAFRDLCRLRPGCPRGVAAPAAL